MAFQFPEAGLAFLRDLAENNNKEWFQANKKRYERDLKNPARALAEAINDVLADISPGHVTPANKAVNRINRDIRFSNDKTPYNTRVWVGYHDQTAPPGASAGFYFGFDLDKGGLGAGAWQPPKEPMTSLREHWAEHHAEYRSIVEDPAFAALFRIGDVPAYKRVPKPWDADHPAADLLKLKGVHVVSDVDIDVVTSPDLIPLVAERFAMLQPMVAYLTAGLMGH